MLEAARRNLRRPWLVPALLAIFVVAGVIHWRSADGQDLASSFVGCRLLSTGHADALYNYDPDNFAGIGPGNIWQRYAAEGGFQGFIHPYVQTPLWALAIEPLCNHTQWLGFERIFLVITMLSLAGTVWLVAKFWTPLLNQPVAIALVLIALWASQPFQYAMFLMQTHALFFFLTILGLVLAEKNRPIAAGLAVALATSVKVTPALLVIYWLLTRRWKAAGSMIAWSAALLLLTPLLVGSHLTSVYLADLHRISRTLLVAINNQSFAAWSMGHFYSEDDTFDSDILPLPTAVRLGSMALMLACTVAGGLLDRQRTRAMRSPGDTSPPVGAMIALVASVIFAPIAWTHYSIILVAPLMVLAQEARALRSWIIAGLALLTLILNYRPLATNIIIMDYGNLALVRGQFYSGVLCILGLAVVWWVQHRAAVGRPVLRPRSTQTAYP